MISESLTFLSTEINKFLNQKLGVNTDARLVLGNIVKASEGESLANKVILSLINVEEDKVAKIRENFTKTPTSVIYKNPPVFVNIYILIAANMTLYADSLKMVAYIMQFFQSQNYFTPLTHPSLDSRIELINVDLFSLNFEQINHIWSTLGGKYLPSVMYKVRQLAVEDENTPELEGKLIETITTELSGKS
ncbi:MAG TPA: DUF4255 domain-containing protein [Ohtaekwangia sp.]|uniref:DUF4255 domain-containing protein n=1 Tax=Ohtaekwangia sp. TaxID=2066019 RepID=UPI002F940D36